MSDVLREESLGLREVTQTSGAFDHDLSSHPPSGMYTRDIPPNSEFAAELRV